MTTINVSRLIAGDSLIAQNNRVVIPGCLLTKDARCASRSTKLGAIFMLRADRP